QSGGGWRRQRVCSDAGKRFGQRGGTGGQIDPADSDAGYVLHKHLLRWIGFSHCVHDVVGDRTTGGNELGWARTATGARGIEDRIEKQETMRGVSPPHDGL